MLVAGVQTLATGPLRIHPKHERETLQVQVLRRTPGMRRRPPSTCGGI